MNPYDCRLLSEEEKKNHTQTTHTRTRIRAKCCRFRMANARLCIKNPSAQLHRAFYAKRNEIKKSRIEKWFQVSWVGHLYIVHCVCLHWNYVMFVRNYKTSSSNVYLARYLHYDRMRSFPSFVAFTSFYRSAKASQQLPSIQCCSPTMCMWPTNERSKSKKNRTKRLLL